MRTIESTTPAHIERAKEKARRQDRRYFERHPDATFRVRPIVAGEDWPFHSGATRVVVTPILPGARHKRFVD